MSAPSSNTPVSDATSRTSVTRRSPETGVTAIPKQTWAYRTARCSIRWGRLGAVVSVHGEVDAANSSQLTEHLQRCADQCQWLVLNFDGLDFMSAGCLSELHAIAGRCATADVALAVVPGEAVARLIRACGSDETLPIATSVATALSAVLGNNAIA